MLDFLEACLPAPPLPGLVISYRRAISRLVLACEVWRRASPVSRTHSIVHILSFHLPIYREGTSSWTGMSCTNLTNRPARQHGEWWTSAALLQSYRHKTPKLMLAREIGCFNSRYAAYLFVPCMAFVDGKLLGRYGRFNVICHVGLLLKFLKM